MPRICAADAGHTCLSDCNFDGQGCLNQGTVPVKGTEDTTDLYCTNTTEWHLGPDGVASFYTAPILYLSRWSTDLRHDRRSSCLFPFTASAHILSGTISAVVFAVAMWHPVPPWASSLEISSPVRLTLLLFSRHPTHLGKPR
ncbi:hypothetical protein VTK26DRAFT_5321 [Humicola hyalothermophila]